MIWNKDQKADNAKIHQYYDKCKENLLLMLFNIQWSRSNSSKIALVPKQTRTVPQPTMPFLRRLKVACTKFFLSTKSHTLVHKDIEEEYLVEHSVYPPTWHCLLPILLQEETTLLTPDLVWHGLMISNQDTTTDINQGDFFILLNET